MNAQIGYVFEFNGHGAFSPDGKVEMTPEQIEQHNSQLALAELEAMKQTGKALLYMFRDESGSISVGTWASKPYQRTSVWRARHSRNNWGCQRTDVWFNADGSTWHGVNIGDNDIVRCSRNKS